MPGFFLTLDQKSFKTASGTVSSKFNLVLLETEGVEVCPVGGGVGFGVKISTSCSIKITMCSSCPVRPRVFVDFLIGNTGDSARIMHYATLP